jgi:hypothetical protein
MDGECMNVQEKIDKKLAEEQEARKTRESSNRWKPSLLGSCYRRHWYAKNAVPETNPTDARGLRVFAAGKIFHDFVQGFYEKEQKEVLIETEKVKGYADLVGDIWVADIKSCHSDGFWYMLRNIVCTLDDGKEVRFNEKDIKGDKVFYYKKERTIVKKRVLEILDEKINNWLQVCWYAVELGKEYCKLVFVSKDDLCIQEYAIPTSRIKPFLDAELEALYSIDRLPKGSPRLYNGKECSFCVFVDKCKQDGNTECNIS